MGGAVGTRGRATAHLLEERLRRPEYVAFLKAGLAFAALNDALRHPLVSHVVEEQLLEALRRSAKLVRERVHVDEPALSEKDVAELAFKELHAGARPSWRNAPGLLVPMEALAAIDAAKVFMGPGARRVKSVDEMDTSALTTFLEFCKPCHAYISDVSLVRKAREARNTVLGHTVKDLHLDPARLRTDVVDPLVALLEGLVDKRKQVRQAAKKAVKTIRMIERDDFAVDDKAEERSLRAHVAAIATAHAEGPAFATKVKTTLDDFVATQEDLMTRMAKDMAALNEMVAKHTEALDDHEVRIATLEEAKAEVPRAAAAENRYATLSKTAQEFARLCESHEVPEMKALLEEDPSLARQHFGTDGPWHGKAALHVAALHNSTHVTEAVELLIVSGARVSGVLADGKPSTPLHVAAHHCNVDAIKAMLSRASKDDAATAVGCQTRGMFLPVHNVLAGCNEDTAEARECIDLLLDAQKKHKVLMPVLVKGAESAAERIVPRKVRGHPLAEWLADEAEKRGLADA